MEFLRHQDVGGLLAQTLVTPTPLTLAALGGIMCERSGVVNIALEGIMLTGAFVGYAVALATHNVWLGVLAAVVAGMLIATLHAALSVSLLVDQIVSGMVINFLAFETTGVSYRNSIESSALAALDRLLNWNIPGLSASPV